MSPSSLLTEGVERQFCGERAEKASFSGRVKTLEDLIESCSQLWRQKLSPVTIVQRESFLVPGLLCFYCQIHEIDLPSSLQTARFVHLHGDIQRTWAGSFVTFLLFVLLLHALARVYPFKPDSFRHLYYACKLSTLVQ